ncbi:hypothetical protein JXA84_07395 [candidate division WOR-3 bacterium]|nr:hypothetical protein [candidate division WOR-3 bacterium]
MSELTEEKIVLIFAALSEYFKNERVGCKILSIKPVHTSDINLWGITRRQIVMNQKSSFKRGWKK